MTARSPVGVVLSLSLSLGAVTACGPPPPTEPLALVDHALWRRAAPEDDPFSAEPEVAASPCDDAGFRVEAPVLEVSTAACDHITLTQPSLAPVRSGDLVHAVAWHVLLSAPEPAEGHMAIALGDDVIWEYRVDIPADEAILKPYVEVNEAFDAGTPVRFHVHNHGDNEWKLLEITTGPREVYDDAP